MALADKRLPGALSPILGQWTWMKVLELETITLLLGLGPRKYEWWPGLQEAEEGCWAIYSSSPVSNCTITAQCCRARERMDELLLWT